MVFVSSTPDPGFCKHLTTENSWSNCSLVCWTGEIVWKMLLAFVKLLIIEWSLKYRHSTCDSQIGWILCSGNLLTEIELILKLKEP